MGVAPGLLSLRDDSLGGGQADSCCTDDGLKSDYLNLLKETSGLDRNASWTATKKRIDGDSRYKAVDSSSRREDWFRDYVRTLSDRPTSGAGGSDGEEDDAAAEERKQREKEKRIEESIRKREEEVHKSLSSSLRERDKEREQHRKDEAITHFKALLADMVRDSEAVWRDTRKQLRKDHRYELAEGLEREEKEKLFNAHIEELGKRAKEQFHRLLEEVTEKDTMAPGKWKEVKKLIKEDPRYHKFSSSDRKREREYENYIHEKFVQAKADFRELLKESKSITYKSRQQLEDNEQLLNDYKSVLEKDKRYLVLECIADEREKILFSYIEDLAQKGAPPPPTASEPSRRSGKEHH